MTANAILLEDVPVKGHLELSRQALTFTSEFSKTMQQVSLNTIKETGAYHVKPSAGQVVGGLLVAGVVGGIYAAVADNAFGVTYQDSQGKPGSFKVMIESPREWVKTIRETLDGNC
jgi:outer membrane lipoprotein SlyB